MQFGVLGPLTVWGDDGAVVGVPGVKVRAMLAVLLVNAGRPVTGDRLIDDIWGDDPPGNPAGTLSAKASQLRRALGTKDLVHSPPPGYRLNIAPDAVDAHRFETLTAQARDTSDLRTRAELLDTALDLWRGNAFADFADDEFAQPSIARLSEQRLVAQEELAETRIALGEHARVATELAALVAAHPLRERLRAAHMTALYGAGRQTEALDSFESHRTMLDEELGLDPGPEIVALHRSILNQNLPVGSAPTRTSNLPAPLTGLVGRDRAIDEISAAIRDERLVTLAGPGGVGKTRLAVAVAHAVLDDFADGAWLVELAGFEQQPLDDLAVEVLAALEIRETGEPADPLERIAAAVRQRRQLIVLDNCEHLVESVADLADILLRSAPGLRILATSREALGLPGEYVWAVEPLEGDAALALFTARARQSTRDFTLDDDTRGAVELLCRRLDGIPLALELAATRVRALGINELVARLDDRFRLLATGHRGAPPRQQTLTAMIDWSWELLGEPEQAVLRRLSVHVDGCTLDAAESVCAGPDLAAEDVPDLVSRLVDRSLVTVVPAGVPRYRLLESVAAYSNAKLHAAGESTAAQQAHRAYYLALAERAAPELYGGEQQRWLRRLDADSANLRAALADSVAARDADSAVRLGNSLVWYWYLRGRLTEASRSLHSVLDVAPADPEATAWSTGIQALQGDTAQLATGRADALDALAGIADAAERGFAMWFLAWASLDGGDESVAGALADDALALFEASHHDWGVAAALLVRARIAHVHSDLDTLERSARRSAELFEATGDRWGLLQAKQWIGALADLTGDSAGAEAVHVEGLRIAEELELWQEVSSHLSWLGWLTLQRGDIGGARELCERALRMAIEQGSAVGETFACMGLALAARRAGDLDDAERLARKLLRSRNYKGADELPFIPDMLTELGYIHELRGDATEAANTHRDALAVSRAMDAPRSVASALVGLAGAQALAGDIAAAAATLRESAAVREAGDFEVAEMDRADFERVTARVTAPVSMVMPGVGG